MNRFSISYSPIIRALVLAAAAVFILAGCSPGKQAESAEPKAESPVVPEAESPVVPEAESPAITSIAVFVPGVVAGSPTYEMMLTGVEEAAAGHPEVGVSLVEGGFNQGEWLTKLMALAESDKYDLIVTSNPAMPEICAEVAQSYPDARFLILDGHLEGNPSIYTFRFDQREQGYLAGYFAGLLSRTSQGEGEVTVGLIAGQEYPDMVRSIRPGYLQGARAAAGEAEIDFRVVGNWYDAGKGSELARDMYRTGSTVILAIAGGANQGVVSAAEATGNSVVWFDSSGYDVAPGTVVGSTRIYLDRAAREKTLLAIKGELPFGSADSVGIADGYISFVTDHPAYSEYVGPEVREALETRLEQIQNGDVSIDE